MIWDIAAGVTIGMFMFVGVSVVAFVVVAIVHGLIEGVR